MMKPFSIFGCCLLIAQASFTLAADYSPLEGPFPAEFKRDVKLEDTKRHKALTLAISYPKTAKGPFPVIIFSHGYGASGALYVNLTKAWAAAGYVVIAPNHDDAGALAGREDAEGSGGTGGGLFMKMTETIEDSANWPKRTDDIKACIDQLDTIEQLTPDLKGKLKHDVIGVGGHSFGAQTAMFLAGGKPVDKQHEMVSGLSDPRPTAFLILSCPGFVPGGGGLEPNSFHDCTRPILFMTGSNDLGRGGEDSRWRRGPYDNSPPGDKYFYFIDGANHGSFTGLGNMTAGIASRLVHNRNEDEPDAAAIFDAIKQGSVVWWDAELKQGNNAREMLANAKFPPGVHLEKK